MKRRAWCGVLLLFLVSSTQAAVRAYVDRNTVAEGDSVQLTLERDGRGDDQPDLTPLKQDFDVLSSSRSSSVQIINGSFSSRTALQLTLAPKHSGTLTIPAISWGAERSTPVMLNIGAAPSGRSADGGERQVFIDTTIDQPQPYVQAASAVTVRLYFKQALYQADLQLPASADVLVQQVGSDLKQEVVKDGQHYQMLERHYLVFAQRSGKLELPGATLSAQIATRTANDAFDDDPLRQLFGNSPFGSGLTSVRPIRVRGSAIELNVRARPVGAQGEYWLPAQALSLTSQWRPDSAQAHVGDPISVNLHLQADGLTAAQLPDVTAMLSLPTGIKAYADDAKLSNSPQGQTLLGSRDQSVALIADHAGQFTLPPVEIHWWDTATDAPRITTVPGRTLDILPALVAAPLQPSVPVAAALAPTGAASTPKHIGTGATLPWPWISAALALLWVMTVVAWALWLCLRRVTAPPRETAPAATASADASGARSEFQLACRADDAPRARRTLLRWVAAARPDSPVAGLRALGKMLNRPELEPLLLQLDRACYAGTAWKGAELELALRDLPVRGRTSAACESDLAPLYPS